MMRFNKKTQIEGVQTKYKAVPMADGGYELKKALTSVSPKSMDAGSFVQGLYYADKSTLVAMVNAPNLSQKALFSNINESLSGTKRFAVSTSYAPKK